MADFRSLPKVDALSRDARLSEFPERIRVEAARSAIDACRVALAGDKVLDPLEEALSIAHAMVASSMPAVINASGVILHTGLGRARLAPSVVEHLARVASGHAAVEFDLESGSRGDRQDHVRQLLCELTGAQDAMVVNNAAAAVLLTLTALAGGKEVVLSRGQMVEIGGSFRMPDIVRQSGCQLVEVGCTNKTRLSDYEEAVFPFTGALLRCHTSNYKIVGFTSQPELRELVELAHEQGVWMIDDQGTGCLVDTSRFGIERVPTIRESVAAGCDVSIGSCDKLLGGPQAGMILGSSAALAEIRRHPLARAVRVDKLTLAALQATLMLYRQGRELELPTLKALAMPLESVKSVAERLCAARAGCVVEPGTTEIGGGSAPGAGIGTYRVGISAPNADNVARELRTGSTPIVGRIENGRVWLDPRTIEEDEIEVVECRLKELT